MKISTSSPGGFTKSRRLEKKQMNEKGARFGFCWLLVLTGQHSSKAHINVDEPLFLKFECIPFPLIYYFSFIVIFILSFSVSSNRIT